MLSVKIQVLIAETSVKPTEAHWTQSGLSVGHATVIAEIIRFD